MFKRGFHGINICLVQSMRGCDGLVGPECVVTADADDLTRLLAILVGVTPRIKIINR